jgi:serine/threonine protein kinase/tetratricopeptide (TPR) repeat protein
MDAERWKLVDDLLTSALELPPDQQDEFLRSKCAGDTPLLEEVSSLLAAHREAGGFLGGDSSHSTTQTADLSTRNFEARSITGQTVSHYRVLGQLGSGGMGVIYQAEDIKLGRRVALKFLPGEVASDRVAFERLQREARAASALDHPNICPIYEFGEHAGQPFIVMQLLEGETLREWIEKPPLPTQDQTLRLNQTLDFAIEIAQGLEAAHHKGIIHRDIKPANIFITTRGDVKILDFGLAKLMEESSSREDFGETTVGGARASVEDSAKLNLTRTGATMGTAHYMSPEQVRGDKLDARTDLFSLGAVLYEMATGQRAFPGESGAVIYDAILHRAPIPLRQLKPSTPAELERITNKAIEKNRNQRYGSAREFVSELKDLQQQLQPGFWGHRRNRLAVAGLALLVTCAASLGWFLERSKHPAPVEAVSSAKARRSVAVLGFRNLAGNTEGDWVSTALSEMISTELSAGQKLRVIPGENVTRMKLDLTLPASTGYGPDSLEKIRKNLGMDIIVQGSYLISAGDNLRFDLQLQEASSGERIASVSESGKQSQIADLVSRAGASLREQLGISAVPNGDLDTARNALPTDPAAAKLYYEGLARLRVYDAMAARQLLTRAIAVDPQYALSHSLLAESLAALGYDAQAKAEARKAFELSHDLPRENQLLIEARYRELSNDFPAAIEVYRTLWKFFPDDLEYGLKLATAEVKANLPKDTFLTTTELRKLPEPSRSDPRIDIADANADGIAGDFQGLLAVATSAAEKAKLQGSELLLSRAKERAAFAWERLGDSDKALAAFSESNAAARAGGNLRMAALALNGTATTLYDRGDLEGARKAYEDALALARDTGAQRNVAAFASNLGNVLYDQGKLAEARRYYQESLDIDRLIDNQDGVASALGSLGNVLEGMGDLTGATHAQEEALRVFREVGDRRGEASTLNNLGDVLSERGDLAAAKQQFEQAIVVQQQIGYRRGRGFSLTGLAELLIKQDRLSEARATAQESIALRTELKDESGLAESQVQMASIAFEQGKFSEAEGLARGAAAEFDKQKSVDDGCSANAILARSLLAQGKIKDAQSAADSAITLCQRGQDRGARFRAMIASALVKSRSGDSAEALAMLEKAHTEARQSQSTGRELESTLVMGEVEMDFGKSSAGRTRLQILEKDAQNKNFALISRQARTLLKKRP